MDTENECRDIEAKIEKLQKKLASLKNAARGNQGAAKNEPIRLRNKFGRAPLNEAEIEKLLYYAKKLRLGHKRVKGAAYFLVKIDGYYEKVGSNAALVRFLSTCAVDRADFQMFRNADKGITIKLEA